MLEGSVDISVVTAEELIYGEDITSSKLAVIEAFHGLEFAEKYGTPVTESVSDIVEKLMEILEKIKEKVIQFFNGSIEFFTSTKKATEEYSKTLKSSAGGRGQKVEIWKKPEIAQTLDSFLMDSEFRDIMEKFHADNLSDEEIQSDISRLETMKASWKQTIMRKVIGKDVMEDEFRQALMDKLLGEKMEEKYFNSPKAIATLLDDAANLMSKGNTYKNNTVSLNNAGLEMMKDTFNSLKRQKLIKSGREKAIIKRTKLTVDIVQITFTMHLKIMNIWKDAVLKYTKSLRDAAETLSKTKSESSKDDSK